MSNGPAWAETAVGGQPQPAWVGLPDPPVEARLLNMPELITGEDYPAQAVSKEEEGSVTVRLLVKEDGRIGDCLIDVSSGSAALDSQTCRLYWLRARFEPGRDRNGRAVRSSYTQKINWKLEGDAQDLLPRQAWMIESTLSLDAQAKIVGCKVSSTGLAAPPPLCDALTEIANGKLAAGTVENAVLFNVTKAYFYPVEPAVAVIPKDSPGEKVAQQVSRLTVDAGGRIVECKGIRYAGAASPERDACDLLKYSRFVPVAAQSPAFVGTIVMTVYLRKQSIT